MSLEASEGPARAELVETSRFLGQEFVVWLWFKAELVEGEFQRPDGSSVEIWLDSHLALRSISDSSERLQLRGIAPSATPEAKLALSRNRWPTQARVSLIVDATDISFTFDAESFSFSGVKIPDSAGDDDATVLRDRMDYLALLDEVWSEQYCEFLLLRLSTVWEIDFVPGIRAWLQGKPTITERGYRTLLKQAKSRPSSAAAP